MPILIALSFRETGLVAGLLLLTTVVFLGLAVRYLLSKLQLLLVARLAATLSIVVVLVLAIGRSLFEMGFAEGLTITLFPIVIITMMIERMSISWEETGALKTIIAFSSSMALAVGSYAVMMLPFVQHVVFNFPETLLIILALTILCGRYTSYRLTEIYRFRSLTTQS